jgi:hypothetical protein
VSGEEDRKRIIAFLSEVPFLRAGRHKKVHLKKVAIVTVKVNTKHDKKERFAHGRDVFFAEVCRLVIRSLATRVKDAMVFCYVPFGYPTNRFRYRRDK